MAAMGQRCQQVPEISWRPKVSYAQDALVSGYIVGSLHAPYAQDQATKYVPSHTDTPVTHAKERQLCATRGRLAAQT